MAKETRLVLNETGFFLCALLSFFMPRLVLSLFSAHNRTTAQTGKECREQLLLHSENSPEHPENLPLFIFHNLFYRQHALHHPPMSRKGTDKRILARCFR